MDIPSRTTTSLGDPDHPTTPGQQAHLEAVALTIPTVQALVGVGQRTLLREITTGTLPAQKIAGRWYVARADLIRWLEDTPGNQR